MIVELASFDGFYAVSHISSLQYLCPPTKGEGGHISFSADPGCRRRQDRFLHARYLLNQLMECHQTCMELSLGQALELIRFW